MSGCVCVFVYCVFVGTVGYGVCDCIMSVGMCWACIVVMLVCTPNVEPQLHVVLCLCVCVLST